MNDHKRGCPGREYVCTCGYDDQVERLEAERAEQWRLRKEAEASRDVEKAVVDSLKTDVERMRNYLARLHVEGTLSEGQAAKAAGITRIEIRILSDSLINSGEVADTRGRP